MLDSIEQIKSPRLRGVAAAGLAFTVVTFISGIVISAVNPKAKVNEVAAPSYLIGMACGAVFGLAYGKKTSDDSTQDRNKTQTNNGKAKQDWRNFVVDRKVQESEEITSFYLKSEDKRNIPQFEAGQYITIKLDVPEQKQPVIRTYSISDYPNPCDYYRISIKRELAPKNTDAPTGLASNFMHDHIQTGAVIAIKPPIGQFILDKEKSLPVVLVSNGIGVTPFMSMVKACSRLNSKRTIWFVHGARNGQTHAFRDEVLATAKENPNLHVHFRYSHPRPEDQGHYDSDGHVDTELIKTLIGQDAEFYLCGSPPFLESLQTGLKEWGVPNERVFHESFNVSKASVDSQSSGDEASKEVEESEIVFASDKTLTWHGDDGTILEFAEANGLNPPYSCRQGVCGTCMCKITEGSVAYQISPTAEIDEDSVLICISKPATPKVVLDI